VHFRSRSKRVRFVHPSPLFLQKRLRLRKRELNKRRLLASKKKVKKTNKKPTTIEAEKIAVPKYFINQQ
jgi:hypothetical protein